MTLVAAIRERLDPSAGVVVAVSGGADSVALLRALASLEGGPLVVAHLNHRLRGDDSDADETFVRGLTAALPNVALACDRLDIAALHRRDGGNLEAVARRERYRWLGEVALRFGMPIVATAHTANDQAETVLHRLLRGSGLQGLRGIAPRRPLCAGVTLVRPMLEATRADVLAYLAASNQPYREDRTNADTRFTRNRIRHDLLPLLARSYNPNVAVVLARLAQQAQDAFAEIERHANALLDACERPAAGPWTVLDPAPLAVAPRALVREALRLLWQRRDWPVGRMGFDDWDRAVAVALDEAASVDLPQRVRLERHGRVVRVGRILPR